jgi:hypothetical protein
VELIKKLADMRNPITTSQGLQLASSLIEGKSVQKIWKNGSPSIATLTRRMGM